MANVRGWMHRGWRRFGNATVSVISDDPPGQSDRRWEGRDENLDRSRRIHRPEPGRRMRTKTDDLRRRGEPRPSGPAQGAARASAKGAARSIAISARVRSLGPLVILDTRPTSFAGKTSQSRNFLSSASFHTSSAQRSCKACLAIRPLCSGAMRPS